MAPPGGGGRGAAAPAGDEWPDEHSIDTRLVSAPLEGPGGVLDEEIETPQSSNVFSFAFDQRQGVLYITFKAPSRTYTKKTKRTNPRTGKDYWMYHKPHVRGPMYAYGGRGRPVPPIVFHKLKSEASAGSVVWDELRVRGSIFGHRYPYRLIAGSVDASTGEVYIPRKATRKGFRVRSVPTVGGGFQRSTLPERRFTPATPFIRPRVP